jgi:hypothetical protein
MSDEQNKEAVETQFEILPPPSIIVLCQTQNEVVSKVRWGVSKIWVDH